MRAYRFVAERKRRGWSQAKLAREAGMNASSLCRLEAMKEPPYQKWMDGISAALKWNGSTDELFAFVSTTKNTFNGR